MRSSILKNKSKTQNGYQIATVFSQVNQPRHLAQFLDVGKGPTHVR